MGIEQVPGEEVGTCPEWTCGLTSQVSCLCFLRGVSLARLGSWGESAPRQVGSTFETTCRECTG